MRLDFDGIRSRIGYVSWTTDEDPPVYGGVNLDQGYPDEGTDDYDTLAVLQEIYASDDGFQTLMVNPLPLKSVEVHRDS